VIANTIASLCGTTTTFYFTMAVCDVLVFAAVVTFSFDCQVPAVD
jgi:hypothetical protein